MSETPHNQLPPSDENNRGFDFKPESNDDLYTQEQYRTDVQHDLDSAFGRTREELLKRQTLPTDAVAPYPDAEVRQQAHFAQLTEARKRIEKDPTNLDAARKITRNTVPPEQDKFAIVNKSDKPGEADKPKSLTPNPGDLAKKLAAKKHAEATSDQQGAEADAGADSAAEKPGNGPQQRNRASKGGSRRNDQGAREPRPADPEYDEQSKLIERIEAKLNAPSDEAKKEAEPAPERPTVATITPQDTASGIAQLRDRLARDPILAGRSPESESDQGTIAPAAQQAAVRPPEVVSQHDSEAPQQPETGGRTPDSEVKLDLDPATRERLQQLQESLGGLPETPQQPASRAPRQPAQAHPAPVVPQPEAPASEVETARPSQPDEEPDDDWPWEPDKKLPAKDYGEMYPWEMPADSGDGGPTSEHTAGSIVWDAQAEQQGVASGGQGSDPQQGTPEIAATERRRPSLDDRLEFPELPQRTIHSTVLPTSLRNAESGEIIVTDNYGNGNHMLTSVGAATMRGDKMGQSKNDDSFGFSENDVFAIADGVGGSARGDLASSMAVNTFLEDPSIADFDNRPPNVIERRMEEVAATIRGAVGPIDGSTTFVGIKTYSYDGKNYLTGLVVGDSRFQVVDLDTGETVYVSPEQAGMLPLDSGSMVMGGSPEAAGLHEYEGIRDPNVLNNSFSHAQKEEGKLPDVIPTVALPDRCAIVAYTDGVSGDFEEQRFTPDEISKAVKHFEFLNPNEIATHLISMANKNDDRTVLVKICLPLEEPASITPDRIDPDAWADTEIGPDTRAGSIAPGASEFDFPFASYTADPDALPVPPENTGRRPHLWPYGGDDLLPTPTGDGAPTGRLAGLYTGPNRGRTPNVDPDDDLFGPIPNESEATSPEVEAEPNNIVAELQEGRRRHARETPEGPVKKAIGSIIGRARTMRERFSSEEATPETSGVTTPLLPKLGLYKRFENYVAVRDMDPSDSDFKAEKRRRQGKVLVGAVAIVAALGSAIGIPLDAVTDFEDAPKKKEPAASAPRVAGTPSATAKAKPSPAATQSALPAPSVSPSGTPSAPESSPASPVASPSASGTPEAAPSPEGGNDAGREGAAPRPEAPATPEITPIQENGYQVIENSPNSFTIRLDQSGTTLWGATKLALQKENITPSDAQIYNLTGQALRDAGSSWEEAGSIHTGSTVTVVNGPNGPRVTDVNLR